MLNSFLQIFLFVSIPLPIAFLFRGRAEALLISPLIGLAVAYMAGMLHLFFDIPIVVAWLLLILGAYAFTLRSKPRRKLIVENWKRPLKSHDYTIIIVGALFVFGFIWKIPPPLGWDARSIWLFIASWLIEDSQTYVQAQQMPGVLQPGYPFGAPAAIAVAWQLHGGVENLWSGVRLIALLTLSASLLTVKTFLNHLATNFSIGFQALITLIVTPILFLVYAGFSRNGYMDPLVANLIALASICMFILIQNNSLTRDERRWLLTLSGLSLFCASSVKQEGFWFSLILLISFAFVDNKSTRRTKLTLSLFPISSFLIWKSSMLAVGSTVEGDGASILSNISEIFDPSSEAWKNYGTIIDRYFDDYFLLPTPLIGIFVFTMLLGIISIQRRTNLRLLIFATFVWFGNWLIIFAPYMLGKTRGWIDGWLASSFDRIMTSQLLFTYIFAVYVFLNLTSPEASESKESSERLAVGINE